MKTSTRTAAVLVFVYVFVVLIAFAFTFTGNICLAALEMPSMFADGMILQRDQPVRILGKLTGASASRPVHVRLAGLEAHANPVSEESGRWIAVLPALPAGGPHVLEISCNGETRRITDVFIGDVWLLAGQSNMSFSLHGATDQNLLTALPHHGVIRAFHQDLVGSDVPLDSPPGGGWQKEDAQTVKSWSAIGYGFARALQAKAPVPVGLIHTAVPGTSISSWVPAASFSDSPAFFIWRKNWEDVLRNPGPEQTRYDAHRNAWEKQVAAARENGRPAPPMSLTVRFGPMSPKNPRRPAAFFNARVASFTSFPVAGVLYYQGETEGTDALAPRYADALRELVRAWRTEWRRKGWQDLPFVLFQLSGYGIASAKTTWPVVRQAQADIAASEPDVLLVPSMDLGDARDIHPTRKIALGRRAADLAAGRFLRLNGERKSAPVATKAILEGRDLVITFVGVVDALASEKSPATYFEIRRADGSWIPAKSVQLQGDRVRIVDAFAETSAPHAVRYLWTNWSASNDSLLFDRQMPVPPFLLTLQP
ncbi:sialate O-acetylesterase [Opitutaceae bacterium TAV4]|nr:sialate O-acetylesterase [Opitutaceae bacterium TAV4]RRK02095.1 sialate O-acetylesterase [Opitutaceae bacterium TAV3]